MERFAGLDLPASLAKAWKAHDKMTDIWSEESDYDVITITGKEMRTIFDGEVNKILKLIGDQL
jgi:hypothetical protein